LEIKGNLADIEGQNQELNSNSLRLFLSLRASGTTITLSGYSIDTSCGAHEMGKKSDKAAMRKLVMQYLIDEFFDSDVQKISKLTEFPTFQIRSWIRGATAPRKGNIRWLMHCLLVPEFKIIAEYQPLDNANPERSIHSQLKKILSGHEESAGIYAFYDSMANLIYLGKSDGNLLGECYQQVQRDIQGNLFPRGARQPLKRSDVVRYISAYYIQSLDEDYAKHVESLILRISKPRLNSNIGLLDRVDPPS
jgi:hypothetical protein